MRLRLLFTVVAMTTAPGLAMAMCSGKDHEQVTMSCPDGQTLDATTQTCMPAPTG